MKAAAVTDIEYMKMFFKVTAVFFLFFIPSVLFASDENINIEDVPELLQGVWQMIQELWFLNKILQWTLY